MLMGILAISVTGMLITPLSIPLLGDLPGPVVITGIALTLGAGLFCSCASIISIARWSAAGAFTGGTGRPTERYRHPGNGRAAKPGWAANLPPPSFTA
ncbi:hypothetical protein [Roseovarius amoyensis]|uniref:hypothetical protein n=1 Tax=Roseovarius amoyensis TaxID=2211448 RepID=UPI0013A69246|nr:hypothetical protein [Roseovarius amoyensis]